MDIEKLAGLFTVDCIDCKHGEGLVGDCPNFDEDICQWQRELAAEAEALFDVEAIQREGRKEVVDIAIQVINEEPEFPGDMPDELWNKIDGTRQQLTDIMRNTARLTKDGIKARLQTQLKAWNL